MDTYYDRWFNPKPLHEDVFGESFAAREIVYDPQNKDLFLRMMKNYVDWKVQHGGGFHPELESDKNKIWWYHKYKYLGAFSGVLFAGCVMNPNFIRRRSYYMKKISIAWCGLVGY